MNYLTTEDLQEKLRISARQAKILMCTPGFPSFKLGAKYRVEEGRLDEWLNEVKEVKFDYSRR